jgi:hypothetical protein
MIVRPGLAQDWKRTCTGAYARWLLRAGLKWKRTRVADPPDSGFRFSVAGTGTLCKENRWGKDTKVTGDGWARHPGSCALMKEGPMSLGLPASAKSREMRATRVVPPHICQNRADRGHPCIVGRPGHAPVGVVPPHICQRRADMGHPCIVGRPGHAPVGVVPPHICQNRADMGRPCIVGRPGARARWSRASPHLPKPGRYGPPLHRGQTWGTRPLVPPHICQRRADMGHPGSGPCPD